MPILPIKKIILTERPAAMAFYEESDEKNYLIVSTYQLLENSLSRKGSIYFIDKSYTVIDSLKMSAGIFRFEFAFDKSYLIASLTNGYICKLDLHNRTTTDFRITNNNAILLSVSISGSRCLTSDNFGSLHIIDFSSGGISSFEGHHLPYTGEPCEVWSAVWHNGDNCILSGGEDAILKIWDIRCPTTKPMNSNKSHNSGIVFLRSEDHNHFISGCYDEFIRRFDSRMLNEPISQNKLEGGVWSVQDAGSNRFIVACMYAGWVLIDKDSFTVIERNTQIGEFLVYGASMVSESLIASCTFNNCAINFDKIKSD